MRAVVLRSLLVICAGGLVLAGVLYVASTVDARPPAVLEVQLTQALTDDPDRALITTSIEITFSEPVEADGAAHAISLEPPVPGSASWSGSTMIFTPIQPLDLDTEYTLTVGSGIRDLAGNEMTELPAPYAFATAGRPVLVASDPADGAEEVAVDAVIELVFSTLMDTAAVESALELRPSFPHDLRWSGERLEIVPRQGLEPARDYSLRLGRQAADIAGVTIGEEVSIGFRIVAPGLGIEALVPADRNDGIAARTPIAMIFDRPVDPDSVDPDLLEITPSVAGTLDLTTLPGDPDSEERMLRFVPSAPLPSNTTFELTLRPGLHSQSGGELAEEVRWSFTTGAPQATVSNQVLFLSDRTGIANVWAMNPDGTGQRQLSAELAPVLDYAAAPNGSSLVVGDGRRLVFLQADGSGRQVLTHESFLEFDPAYAPDGSEVAFARADAANGEPLGLWTWEVGAGGTSELELPAGLRPGATPAASGVDAAGSWPRVPRYAPDGQALAYVDLNGHIGILELPAERHTRIEAHASSAPVWQPDSGGIFVTLGAEPGPTPPAPFVAPVAPLIAAEPAGIGLAARSGTRLGEAGFGTGAGLGAVAAEGRIAYIDADGVAFIADEAGERGRVVRGLETVRVDEIRFGPGDETAMIVTGRSSGSSGGVIERVDLDTGQRTRLVRGGWHVRWLP